MKNKKLHSTTLNYIQLHSTTKMGGKTTPKK